PPSGLTAGRRALHLNLTPPKSPSPLRIPSCNLPVPVAITTPLGFKYLIVITESLIDPSILRMPRLPVNLLSATCRLVRVVSVSSGNCTLKIQLPEISSVLEAVACASVGGERRPISKMENRIRIIIHLRRNSCQLAVGSNRWPRASPYPNAENICSSSSTRWRPPAKRLDDERRERRSKKLNPYQARMLP